MEMHQNAADPQSAEPSVFQAVEYRQDGPSPEMVDVFFPVSAALSHITAGGWRRRAMKRGATSKSCQTGTINVVVLSQRFESRVNNVFVSAVIVLSLSLSFVVCILPGCIAGDKGWTRKLSQVPSAFPGGDRLRAVLVCGIRQRRENFRRRVFSRRWRASGASEPG
jgi:hypothetical protein